MLINAANCLYTINLTINHYICVSGGWHDNTNQSCPIQSRYSQRVFRARRTGGRQRVISLLCCKSLSCSRTLQLAKYANYLITYTLKGIKTKHSIKGLGPILRKDLSEFCILFSLHGLALIIFINVHATVTKRHTCL